MKNAKFGTIYGIFIPNVTMMFGVILFLRLTPIMSHVGIVAMGGILLLSLIVMLITSMSIASIATNLKVGAGGIYYLISRTLGIEMGGAVGFAIYLAQLISISLTITGFAYLFYEQFSMLSLELIETITLILLVLIAATSTAWALKIQVAIFILIMASVGAVFFGSPEYLVKLEAAEPFYSHGSLDFWRGFALFYPAMTGIEAGMALSGNLRNPARAFLFGNISSLLWVAVVYGSLSIFAYINIPNLVLKSNPFALVEFAWSSNLVVAGIFAATLSSALGSLVGAPRILQSMSDDGLVPSFLVKGYGKHNEPIWALLMTAVIALITMLLTSLDQILPILTMICLLTYGMVNFIAAMAELMNTPSWRPRIRVHWSISLMGSILCVILMLFISPAWGLITLLLVLGCFLVLQRRNLNAGFKDFSDSIIFFIARLALYRLSAPAKHAITWHPQVLLLSTAPTQNLFLAHMANALTYRSGILTIASVVPEDTWSTPQHIRSTQRVMSAFFQKKNISCMVRIHPQKEFFDGFIDLIKAYGIGPIQPNTVLLHTEEDTNTKPKFAELVNSCFLMRKNLIFMKGLDHKSNEDLEYFFSSKKNINIWWNNSSNESFDLLVSLATTLIDSKKFGEVSIELNAISPHEQATPEIKNYLESYLFKSRLKMKLQIYLETNSENSYDYINKYSQKADLTCIALSPFKSDQSRKDYQERVREVLGQCKDLPAYLIATSFDDVKHDEIYHYPEISER